MFEDCPVLFAIFSSSPGERGGSFPCGSFPGTTPPAFAANSRTLQGNQWMTSAKFAAFDNCKCLCPLKGFEYIYNDF